MLDIAKLLIAGLWFIRWSRSSPCACMLLACVTGADVALTCAVRVRCMQEYVAAAKTAAAAIANGSALSLLPQAGDDTSVLARALSSGAGPAGALINRALSGYVTPSEYT